MRAFVVVGLLSSACLFAPDRPPGAELLCGDDAACPDDMKCDTVHHLCVDDDVEIDGEAPFALSVEVAPATLRDGIVTATLTFEEALASEPTLEFSDGADVLAVELDGQVARGLVDVDGLAEGTYRLLRYRAEDLAGNTADAPLTALVFSVDRTAPRLTNVIATGADGVFSDVEGSNTLTLSFNANEPLGALRVQVGGSNASLEDTCVENALLNYSCALTLGAGLFDGVNTLVIEAEDDAGNELTAQIDIDVDAAPAGVVGSETVVRLRAPDGTLKGGLNASPDDVVELEIVMDDDPGADAAAALLGANGGRFELALDDNIGRRFVFSRALAEVPAGVYDIELTLVDDVQHVSTLNDDVPRLVVSVEAFARCEAEFACADLDGDGVFGRRPGCLEGNDCDDENIAIFPGMVEIGNDGIDNNCDGVETPLSAAIYVDGAANVKGDGSAGAPLISLEAAILLSNAGAPGPIVLRAGTVAMSGSEDVTSDLLGGYEIDAVTGEWHRQAGARTRVIVDNIQAEFVSNDILVLRDLEIVGNPDSSTHRVSGPGSVIIENVEARLIAEVPLLATALTTESLTVSGFTSTVTDSVVDALQVFAPADATFARSRIGDASVGSSARFVNTVHDGALICDGCTRAEAVHITSRMQDDRVPFLLFGDGEFTIRNSILSTTSTSTGLIFQDVGAQTLLLDNVLLQAPVDATVYTVDNVAVPFSGLANTCASVSPRCATDGIFEEQPNAFVEFPQLRAGDVAVDRAVKVTAPTQAIVDFNGDCRFIDEVPDLGAVELQP